MSKSYAKSYGYGQDNYPKVGFPSPVKAQARYYTENSAGTSSVITLTDNTTQIEIGAAGASGVIMRWVPVTETAGVAPNASVTATTFDHFVPAGEVREFVVPKETQGVTSLVGVNVENGLYKRVAFMNTGIGSVFATEY